MKFIIGFIVVTGSVLGGFVISGGTLLALWHPPELLIIAGGSLGGFLISNPPKVIKAVLKELPGLLKGSKYTKAAYLDLLALMYDLFMKARKEGLMSLEAHVEEPENSPIFTKYPAILADHHVVEFVCDYLRLMVTGTANAMEMETLMDLELDTHHAEAVRKSWKEIERLVIDLCHTAEILHDFRPSGVSGTVDPHFLDGLSRCGSGIRTGQIEMHFYECPSIRDDMSAGRQVGA